MQTIRRVPALRMPRPAGALLAVPLLLALVLAACTGGRDLVVTESTPTPTPSATASPAPSPTTTRTASPTPEPTPAVDANDLRGFAVPIEGACLPDNERLMPNAPREYRNGIHEGVDFYPGLACAPISIGTSVYAMQAGTVVRAELDYQNITPQQVSELAERTATQGFSDAETLDIYRGRQVWIDHGDGVVTRYAHLAAIAEGIRVGAQVERGQLLGAVGDSGTPESVTAPGTEYHLHAEVRLDGSFLGDGLSPAEVRRLYEALFSAPATAGR